MLNLARKLAPLSLPPLVAAAGGGGTGLLTGLVAYWSLDETGGTRADATGGGNDLADNGTTGGAPGIINGGANFTATAGNYLQHADNAALDPAGYSSWFYSLWVKFGSLVTNQTILCKDGRPSPVLWVQSNTVQFIFLGASTYTFVSSGTLTTGVWYNLVAGVDAPNSQISLSVNNGTPVTAAWNPSTNPLVDTGGAFAVGAYPGGSLGINAIIDELGFWGRAPTGADRTALYNGGAGLSYSGF